MIAPCILCGSNPAVFISRTDLIYVRCGQCGFVWQPVPKISDKYYTEEARVGTDDERNEARALNSQDRIHTFKKYIDLSNLCEVGCAEGMFLVELKKSGYTNVIGVEPNKDSFAEAKKRGLEVYQKSEEEFGPLFLQKNISRVALFHVIEHIINPIEYLLKIKDAMGKGDYLIIETPDVDSASIKKSKLKHKLLNFEHIVLYNEKTLKKIIEKSGFRVVATGRRDFSVQHMSIRKMLFTLGIYKTFDIKAETPKLNPAKKPMIPISNKKIKFTNLFIKPIVQKILYFFIILLKKQDFIWIIAQKY